MLSPLMTIHRAPGAIGASNTRILGCHDTFVLCAHTPDISLLITQGRRRPISDTRQVSSRKAGLGAGGTGGMRLRSEPFPVHCFITVRVDGSG